MTVDEGHIDSFIPALHKPSALLPIARHKEALLYTIETTPVTVLIGETGSGKSTQLPQYLLDGGWCIDGKQIAITQPRRVAATTVASRVAEEQGCVLGQEVGYTIRFEDVTSSSTKIKFLTDGLLLREALVDPLLARYSVIIVDEAHERSLSSDVLLGLLKKIRKKRPELRIVVSSATLHAEDFLRFFAGDDEGDVARIVSIEGRSFPIDTHYLTEACEGYVTKAVQTVMQIHEQEGDGDVLVFLTGREEIETCIEMLSERTAGIPADAHGMQVSPLYAGLPTEQQMYVFEPAPDNTRKVIVATNIAEASVTIPGIVYVVDCGFVKIRAYNPQTGIEMLTATPISQAAATQRTGRAGRTKAGKCYRLYTADTFQALAKSSVPEIQRSNLAPMILQLKCLGIDNIARFDYLTPPPSILVVRALETLYALGALDDYARLAKPLGIRMAELAIEPMMAKVLLAAPDFGCLSEMLSIAAMTTLQGAVWVQHEGDKKTIETSRWKFAVDEGDHMTLLNVYQAFVSKGKKGSSWCRTHMLNYKSLTKAVSVRNQLKRYIERFGISVDESLTAKDVLRVGGPDRAEQIRRCLTSGYFVHAARMQPDGTFQTINGTVLHAHPSSLMFVGQHQFQA